MTLFYIGAGVGYLYWRALYTLNTGALAVSLPFLFADIAGFGYFLLFAHNLWRWTERKPSPPPPGRAVDVFIPTYNEDINVLRPTIEAALAMDYPHATYVLDDGRRDEVRRLCVQLGATYLTRDTNDGAKAGNINAALPRTSGEFIAFFDADHAPFRNFLTELLGYFEDPTVALVQTPQAYYNLDSFQHGGSAPDGSARPWHEQSVFYDVMMPGKDRFNAAFWCGSSAVLRRSALESIGGVDTRTVTEDMHTSMGLHAAGWRSVYDPRELAIGIAPHDASGFLVQRSRWARGALQILRHDNPLTRPGLRWNQRLAYFAAVAYVFEYIPRLIYLLTPIACLLVGQLPMRSVAWTTLTFVIAFWALGLLTSRLLTRGRNPYLDAERYHLLKLTVMLQACFTYLWSRPHKFNVTPKAGDGSDHFAASMSLILVQLAIGWLSVLAIAWAGLAYFTGAPWQLKGESLVVTAAWALLNAGLVALLTRSIFQHHHRRKVYRFNVQAAGTIQCDDMAGPARILDLSAAGVGWESAVPAAPGKIANLRFVLAGQEIAAGVTVLTRRYDGAKFRYGGEFATLSAEDARHLILYLYQRHAPAIFHGQHAVLAQHANDADSLPLAS